MKDMVWMFKNEYVFCKPVFFFMGCVSPRVLFHDFVTVTSKCDVLLELQVVFCGGMGASILGLIVRGK